MYVNSEQDWAWRINKCNIHRIAAVLWFYLHVESVETYKQNIMQSNIDCIDFMSRVSKDAFLIDISMVQRYLNSMSWLSKRTTQNTTKYHIFQWFHVERVERHHFLRITMYILIQSLRITIFFELKLRTTPNFELNLRITTTSN